MKIILREDIDTLGDRDEIKEVAAGYARNFLIPKGLAVRATDSELKQREQRLKYALRREKKIEEKLAAKVTDIHGAGLEIEENAAHDGKLYGSVTARMIADLLTERLGIEVNKSRVGLEAPIKKVGEYIIPVNLGGKKKADITVKVIPVGGVLPEAPAEVLAAQAAEKAEAAREKAAAKAAAAEATEEEEPETAEEPAEEPEEPEDEKE